MHDHDNNPFGNDSRKQVLTDLMNKGLIRRITLIEGNYPTKEEQRNFLKRIMNWLSGKQ